MLASSSNSQQVQPQGSQREKKAKKSVAAIILSSGAAASIGLSSFFTALQTSGISTSNNQRSSLSDDTFPPNKHFKSPNRRDRRAQSLYVLPEHRGDIAAAIEASGRNSSNNNSSPAPYRGSAASLLERKPASRFSFDFGASGRPSHSSGGSGSGSGSGGEESPSSSTGRASFSKESNSNKPVVGFRKRATTFGNAEAKPPLVPAASTTATISAGLSAVASIAVAPLNSAVVSQSVQSTSPSASSSTAVSAGISYLTHRSPATTISTTDPVSQNPSFGSLSLTGAPRLPTSMPSTTMPSPAPSSSDMGSSPIYYAIAQLLARYANDTLISSEFP